MGLLVEFALLIIEKQMLLYLFFAFVFFLVQLFFVKKHIYSIFDPLLIFIFFNGFSWATVLMVSEINSRYSYFIDLSIFNVCFFLPSFFFKKMNVRKIHDAMLENTRKFDFQVFYTISIILFFSTLALWLIKGIPILSENPDRAKSEYYEGGFGFVRYIHFVTPLFCIFFSVYCLVYLKNNFFRKIILITVTCFSILVTLSTGAKSALLPVVFVFALIGSFDINNRNAKRIRKLSYIFMVGACLFVGVVFSIVSNQGGIDQILKLLMIRMIAFGDTFFFWYEYDLEKKIESINLFAYLLSPLLSMLKIIEQQYPLGSQLVSAVTGENLVSFGPNGQLPVVLSLVSLHIKYALSLMFGFIFFYIRNNAYILIKTSGLFGSLIFIGVFINITYVYTDVLLLLSIVYSSIITFVFIYLAMLLLRFSTSVQAVSNGCEDK
ncbi:O-antigen polymerase [Aeromonas sp. ASNIH2]|uniref:O-antigen polymerase n=1 Tax=Aeromonas sp. ASNIH2 TaxID=1636607 RepID=UPI0013155B6B|nr:O-antigen polymerase [Aeromonas sp. ASNIH2]